MNKPTTLTRTADISLRRSIRRAFIGWRTLSVRAGLALTRLAASRDVQDAALYFVAFIAVLTLIKTGAL